MRLHGWGRYPTIDAQVHTPATVASLIKAVSGRSDVTVIARGMGRSYGDSALAPHVISTRRLNLLLDFDETSGTVRCSAGVTLAQLADVFVPKGWFLPVTPGTKFITVGGAIASDVHGKNHHRHGCFSQFVASIDIMLASGEVVTCSEHKHADLFHASCGGMGLTGIILSATLFLKHIDSTYIAQTTLKASSLEEATTIFELHSNATYSVAWIDCLAGGRSLGRSLVMLGEHAAKGGLATWQKRPLSIPFDMPTQLLNRHSIRLFNNLYYYRIQKKQSEQLVHYDPFFYPLDGIHQWNRLYGKNGFSQYQFVLPKSAGLAGMRTILQRISDSGRGSFLAVLKAFGKQSANLLSFPMEGYTLALDFRIENGLFELLDELDAMVLDHGGRLYLTKDIRMSEQVFKRSYPRWEEFQNIRSQYGAQGKFASLQSKRLGLD